MKHMLLAIIATLPIACHAAGDVNQKPNILFLFADDLALLGNPLDGQRRGADPESRPFGGAGA